MVSKASEDFPEPLTPVTTVIWFMGIENEMFLRLLTRAPSTSIASWVMLIPMQSRTDNKIARLANHTCYHYGGPLSGLERTPKSSAVAGNNDPLLDI